MLARSTDVLRREEAASRAQLVRRVTGYDIELDLTPDGDTFRSTSRIGFRAATPGAETFVDLCASRVVSAELNGAPVPPARIGVSQIDLTGLAADNELVVTADMPYSTLGEGLHRFVDPADDRVYLWSESFVNNARRVFACFDQPDLKAPFRVRVRAPEDWTVLSNGAGSKEADGTWTFAETPPISTYLTTLVAGPWHSVYAQAGDIPLGLHVRQSLAEHLDADELFEITRQSFDFYGRTFAVPYPFVKYDQVFCPELFAGAMENPACVKFTDEFIYRSRVTEGERAVRAVTIAHEMAHMWFGDLVTLRWWDDLWLNESFAEYIGTLATVEATRFTRQWTWFCASTKAWGYRQDELPSTHPIAGEAPDTEAAMLNLDGISYAKGAGTLKQLVTWVGWEAFLAGLHAYFQQHAYGSATLADLLAALEPPSGRDLRGWSAVWLESAGVNVLRPDAVVEPPTDGVGETYRSVAVIQAAPEDQPTLRAHRIGIGLYDRSEDRLVLRDRIEAEVQGPRTDIPALAGVRVPDLLLLNDGDLTWAKIRLDDRSLATARDGGFCRLNDSLARALIWASIWDMTHDAELPVAEYLELVLDGIGREGEITLVEDVLSKARRAINVLGRAELRDERLAAYSATCRALAREQNPGSDLQLAYARAYGGSVASTRDVDRIRGWLEGRKVPDGLAIDVDLRWDLITRLAILGAVGDEEIAEEERRDPTSGGVEAAAGARTAMPTPEAKAEAWRLLTEPDAVTVGVHRKIARHFWQPEQLDLTTPYVDHYLEILPSFWRERPADMAWGFTEALFPSLLVDDSTLERVDAVLDTDLAGAPRRLLLEQRSDLQRALQTRAADTAPEPAPA